MFILIYLYLYFRYRKHSAHVPVLKRYTGRVNVSYKPFFQAGSIESKISKTSLHKSCIPYEYVYYKTLISAGFNMSIPIYKYYMTSYHSLQKYLKALHNLQGFGFRCNFVICYDSRFSIQEIRYICAKYSIDTMPIFYFSRQVTPIKTILALNAFAGNNSYKSITSISLLPSNNFMQGVYRDRVDIANLKIKIYRTYDIAKHIDMSKVSLVNDTCSDIKRKIVLNFTFDEHYISLTRKDSLYVHLFDSDERRYISVGLSNYKAYTVDNVLYIETTVDVPKNSTKQIYFGLTTTVREKVCEEDFDRAVSTITSMPPIRVNTGENTIDDILNKILPMRVLGELLVRPFNNLHEIEMFMNNDFGEIGPKYKYLSMYVDMLTKAFGVSFRNGGILPKRLHYFDGEIIVDRCKLKVISGPQNYVKIDGVEYSNFPFYPLSSLVGRDVVVCNDIIC